MKIASDLELVIVTGKGDVGRDRNGIARLKDLLAGGPAVISLPLLAASPADLPRLAALGRTLESAWVP